MGVKKRTSHVQIKSGVPTYQEYKWFLRPNYSDTREVQCQQTDPHKVALLIRKWMRCDIYSVAIIGKKKKHLDVFITKCCHKGVFCIYLYIYIYIYPPIVERITARVQDRTKGKMSFHFTLQREEWLNEGKYLIWDPRELDTISLKVIGFHDTETIT